MMMDENPGFFAILQCRIGNVNLGTAVVAQLSFSLSPYHES